MSVHTRGGPLSNPVEGTSPYGVSDEERERWGPWSALPPPMPGPPLLRQAWVDAVFVHWAVDPAAVAPLLPEGTRPDTLGGVTYVGLVAFQVPSTLALGTLPQGAFCEVNVRLYSVDEHGRRGVVFLTMDTDAAHVVAAARAVSGLPYVWSDVSLKAGPGGRRAGAVRRRFPGAAEGSWALRVGEPLDEASVLDRFLTARWGLHTRHLGRTWWFRVSHRPWPLHSATLLHYDGNLLSAAGVEVLDKRPVSVLWASGVSCPITPTLV